MPIQTIAFALAFFTITSASLAMADAGPYAVIEKFKATAGDFFKPSGGELYILKGDQLPEEADKFGIKLLPLLVECMSREDKAVAKFNGNPVAVGTMCWYGLRTMTYFECSDRRGDVISCKDVPPEFEPGANATTLRKVQSLWQKELKRKPKRFNLT